MTLRMPARIDQVSLFAHQRSGAYPPAGFLEFAEHALGNGDAFGLYWPIGREFEEPLVIEMRHDGWALAPAYSSLDRFSALTADIDEGDWLDLPTLEQDPDSPMGLLAASRTSARAGDVTAAAEYATKATERLPEYTGAHAALWAVHLRSGNLDGACRSAMRAVISPPSFTDGVDAAKVWRWLSQQADGPSDLRDDPLWRERERLASPPTGGAKDNPVYAALLEALAGYEAEGRSVEALTLLQAYAEFMSRETISFQERQGFSLDGYRERYEQLEYLLPSGPRRP